MKSMRSVSVLLALLPAAVMAQEPECYPWTWVPAPTSQPEKINTPSPKPRNFAISQIRKSAKRGSTHRKAKRIKAQPKRIAPPTTRDLPPLVRIPVTCPKRPPVTEVFLPPGVTPPQPRLPGLLPPSMPYSPYVPVGMTPMPRPVQPAPPVVVSPPWFEGPLAVVPPGGFTQPEQSNDLPTFPPDGTPAKVPLPGTLALLAVGVVLVWRVKR